MSPWYYDTYCIKAAGFTRRNLPVINSLARGHVVYEAMNVYCESFLCARWLPFSSVVWDCVSYRAENDPADDEMPWFPFLSCSDVSLFAFLLSHYGEINLSCSTSYNLLKKALGFTFSRAHSKKKNWNLTFSLRVDRECHPCCT